MPKNKKQVSVVIKKATKAKKKPKSMKLAIKGKGEYSWKQGVGDIVKASASTLGGALGGPVGALIGGGAATLFNKITGLGKYKVKGNTLWEGEAPASFGNGDGSVVVTHREFLGVIRGSTNFTTQAYFINPGNLLSFPWLAPVALSYEEWQPLGMVYWYKPTSGYAVSGSNPALGAVMLSTLYDSTEPLLTTRIEVDNHQYTTTCLPCESMAHPVECKPSMNPLSRFYVRPHSDTSEDSDNRFSDLGRVQISTEGMPASGNPIGELWVTFQIKLLKPRLAFQSGELTLAQHSYISSGASATDWTVGLVDAPGGNDIVYYGSSGAYSLIVYFRRPGRYLVNLDYATGGTAVTTTPFVYTPSVFNALSGCTIDTSFYHSIQNVKAVYGTAPVLTFSNVTATCVEVTTAGASIGIPLIVMPAGWAQTANSTLLDVVTIHVNDALMKPRYSLADKLEAFEKKYGKLSVDKMAKLAPVEEKQEEEFIAVSTSSANTYTNYLPTLPKH